ncbi:MAG: hypothetical protein VYA34_05845 [Myxococcota bacterium]|nr:hypothetical protein [Myxococcota bacterium]
MSSIAPMQPNQNTQYILTDVEHVAQDSVETEGTETSSKKNQELPKDFPLEVEGSSFVTSEGTQVSSRQAGAVAPLQAPVIPPGNYGGDSVVDFGYGNLSAVGSGLSNMSAMSGADALTFFHAAMALSEAANKDQEVGKAIQDMGRELKYAHKEQKIDDLEAQHIAERKEAWLQFGMACATAVISAACCFLGPVGMVAGGSVGAAGGALGTAISKQSGFQRDADDATERQSYGELNAEQAASIEESGKNIREANRQAHQAILKKLENVIEQRLMVVDKMTSW